jgi:hypothetical protein
VISKYIAEALHRAQYRILDDGLFCATVAGLPGVIATGKLSRYPILTAASPPAWPGQAP